MTQNPHLKSEIVSKANRSQSNSPVADLKYNERHKYRMKSIDPQVNVSIAKYKKKKQLIHVRGSNNSDKSSDY